MKRKIFSIVLAVALIGAFSHIYSLWVKNKHSFLDTISSVFDDLGLNVLVGLLTYIAFEIAFQNIDKKYGLLYEFNYPDLIESMKGIERKSEVKILSIFLRVFTKPSSATLEQDNQREHVFDDFDRTRESFKKTIIDLCRNKSRSDKKVKVSILLLDPVSLSARQRRKEILDSNVDLDIISEIIKSLQELIELYFVVQKENILHRGIKMLDIRVYDRTPPFSLFRVDDKYSFSFYPRNKTVQDADHWSFYEGTPFQKFITSTFDEVWYEESTFVFEKYMYINLYSLDENTDNQLKEIYFIDYYKKKDGWFPEKKFIILFPNQDQAMKISNYVNMDDRLVLDYRNNKKISGKLCRVHDHLTDLNMSSVNEAENKFRELAIEKYPAGLIIGPMTKVSDLMLIII